VSIDGGAQSIADDKGKNAVHLHCPREGCGSLILRKGDGELKMGSGGMVSELSSFLSSFLFSLSKRALTLLASNPVV
jgi:hypothetical protein